MARIVWTIPALEDLDRIADYIALEHRDAAKQLVRKVFEQTTHLAEYANMGKPLDELEGSIYRELVIVPCRLFYRIDEDVIYIIHIMRSEQLFRKDRFD